MLILVETPAGYGLFKVVDKAKVKDVDNLMDAFATPEAAATVYVCPSRSLALPCVGACAIACLTRVSACSVRSVKLKHFSKFADTAAALNAASAICEGTLDANLKTFLQESVVAKVCRLSPFTSLCVHLALTLCAAASFLSGHQN